MLVVRPPQFSPQEKKAKNSKLIHSTVTALVN
jgi:hypothetical protein